MFQIVSNVDVICLDRVALYCVNIVFEIWQLKKNKFFRSYHNNYSLLLSALGQIQLSMFHNFAFEFMRLVGYFDSITLKYTYLNNFDIKKIINVVPSSKETSV